MKKYSAIIIALFITVSLAIIAYAGHNHMVIPYEAQALGYTTTMPFPAGGDLRHHITGHMTFKKWDLWPGKGKMYEGTEPHGALLTVYINDIASKSIKKMKGMANNAIIVKENYTPDKKLAAITVMYKVKGYNPKAGDWFWVKYGADYNIMAEGKVKGCIDCHGSASDNDYIFTGNVVK
jgi:hypothetical protein